MKFDFQTRSEYLANIKEWQAEYVAKIQQIRRHKVEFKDAQRKDSWSDQWKAKTARWEAVRELNQLVNDRQAAREEAQRQYLKEHALASV